MNKDFCPFKCFIELYFCLDCLLKSLSYCFVGCFQSHMNRMQEYSKCRTRQIVKDYGVLDVECKQK